LLDGLDASEVPDGETVSGDVCWKLSSSHVGKVLMFYTDPFMGTDTYFSLGL
jgi:hypothetical protein